MRQSRDESRKSFSPNLEDNIKQSCNDPAFNLRIDTAEYGVNCGTLFHKANRVLWGIIIWYI